ncbi:hypothetical protein QBC44DRAFT_353984 [Cladorrhinum sp. PSN332]|nr:hypothetical protein QBC44DRAFT_353984 [Cladorrhinum sp. PSN332]
MPVTLANSFPVAPPRPLPNYPTNGGLARASASGASTINTEPPKFAVASAALYWQNSGDSTLTHITATQGNNNALTTEFLSEVEPAIYHASEGDVVRSSAIYLLHPVNQALSLWTGNGVFCQSEATANGIRGDITYYRGTRAFAVVEFKKRGVIKPAEFTAAIKTITAATTEATLVSQANNRANPENTFFDGDSTILIKQASSYAINHRTRYVALFNWDALVLCHFSQLDPAKSQQTLIIDGIGNYCDIEVIPFTQSHRMRVSLLGFLAEAYNNTP